MKPTWFKYAPILIITLLSSKAFAGDVFRYNYPMGDTLHYSVSINSDLHFNELGNLAQLLNLDKITHNVEMDVDLSGLSTNGSGNFIAQVAFRRISIILIAGDSVYTNNGKNWGAVKPGSAYALEVTPRGKLVKVVSGDTVGARQVLQMVQRFFPAMPEQAIDSGYSWLDSVNFEIELPDEAPETIFTNMNYIYLGEKSAEQGAGHEFAYSAVGESRAANGIVLNGEGSIIFHKDQGRLQSNLGHFNISAEISLSMFGLPSGMGTTPVDIDSDIIIKLKNEE